MLLDKFVLVNDSLPCAIDPRWVTEQVSICAVFKNQFEQLHGTEDFVQHYPPRWARE